MGVGASAVTNAPPRWGLVMGEGAPGWGTGVGGGRVRERLAAPFPSPPNVKQSRGPIEQKCSHDRPSGFFISICQVRISTLGVRNKGGASPRRRKCGGRDQALSGSIQEGFLEELGFAFLAAGRGHQTAARAGIPRLLRQQASSRCCRGPQSLPAASAVAKATGGLGGAAAAKAVPAGALAPRAFSDLTSASPLPLSATRPSGAAT